jgi:hypothetical protein
MPSTFPPTAVDTARARAGRQISAVELTKTVLARIAKMLA